MQTDIGFLALEGLVAVAAMTDWRTSRLPNWLTFGGLATGLALSALPGAIGPMQAALGAACALLLLLPLWLIRATGAGDVKLLAAVGAFTGLPGIFHVLLLTMLAAGALALAMGGARGDLRRMSSNAAGLVANATLAAIHGRKPAVPVFASAGKLPYGVCAFAGTTAWLAWQVFVR